MRLSLSDLACLPFSCALFDRDGRQLASTPEWRGVGLGALSFDAGIGTLVIAPDGSVAEVDGLVTDLIGELLETGPALARPDRMAAEMVAAALALVAGRPPLASSKGSVADVVEHAQEGIRRSLPGLGLDVQVEVEATVRTPAAVALGVVQLARNASRHAGADRVTLRVSRGPTFRVEWSAPGDGVPIQTSRRQDQRGRWGMGFTRMLADSLGGVVTAPAAIASGVMASSIGLGSSRFSAPIAVVVDGRVERATRAWDEETGLPPGSAADQRVLMAVGAAAEHPGQVGYCDVFRARAVPGKVWVGVAPQSSLGRARDVLRGIQHENALLSAPEPHATRVYALAAILTSVVSGEPIDPVPAATWGRDFPAACSALGTAPAAELDPDRLRYPDPRVAAYLLATLEGHLKEAPGGGGAGARGPVDLVAGEAQKSHPLARVLGEPGGAIRIVG